MLILRYGPKMYLQEDDQYHRDNDEDEPTENDDSSTCSDNNYDIDADNRENEASDTSIIDRMTMKKGNESIASLVHMNDEMKEKGGVFDIDANDIALLQAWKLRRQSMEDDDDDDVGSISFDDMASDVLSSSDLQSTQTTKSYGSNITPKSHHSMETNLIGNTHARSVSSSSGGSNMKPSLSNSSLPRRHKNKTRKKKKPFQGPSFHS